MNIFFILFLFVSPSLFLFFLSPAPLFLPEENKNININIHDPEISGTSENCEITRVDKIIDGNSMEPMIKDGQKIILLRNFYICSQKKPQINDLVAYEYGGNIHPLIKKIVATSENSVEIRNKKLFIDNSEVKNSIGKSYVFSEGELNMIGLYISDTNTLPENSYFVLGDNVNNSTDSRKFGAISAQNFLGKFEKFLVE